MVECFTIDKMNIVKSELLIFRENEWFKLYGTLDVCLRVGLCHLWRLAVELQGEWKKKMKTLLVSVE